MADVDIVIDNTDAKYPSWPLIWFELTANMSAVGDPKPSIYREESPNFARRIFIESAVTLDPAPTALAPVKIFIDPFNRTMYVDPESSHAQNGLLLKYLSQESRFFYLLPNKINWIQFRDWPDAIDVGVRWRRAYV